MIKTSKIQAIIVSDSFLFDDNNQPIWGHIDVINHLGIPYQLILDNTKYSRKQLEQCITESFILLSEMSNDFEIILNLKGHEIRNKYV